FSADARQAKPRRFCAPDETEDQPMKITIRDRATNAVLATAADPSQVLSFEGHWYFAPEAVSQSALKVTSDTYTCSYKGTCNWVSFDDGSRLTPQVAWVYLSPKAGYEQIAGRYGFYAGSRLTTIEERE
ncbi:MAG: hypothetical protein CFK52_03800, partial [Chloracidobacterium sp. CP2_5A]